LATRAGVDLLHIKGPAVPPTVAPGPRLSHDADVLVRPQHISLLTRALTERGWRQRDGFATGSPFGHAMTVFHDVWGYADIHRLIPGVSVAADSAFDRLWAGRIEYQIASVSCQVPSDAAHRVILLLNAAKGGLRTANLRNDVRACWTDTTAEERTAVTAVVTALGAHVAFSVVTGEIDRYRGHPGRQRGAHAARGGTRAQEWWARIRAAPTMRESLAIAARAGLVNTDHLRMMLGREPTRLEVFREFLARPRHAVEEARRGSKPR
jgi:hypothetical protein